MSTRRRWADWRARCCGLLVGVATIDWVRGRSARGVARGPRPPACSGCMRRAGRSTVCCRRCFLTWRIRSCICGPRGSTGRASCLFGPLAIAAVVRGAGGRRCGAAERAAATGNGPPCRWRPPALACSSLPIASDRSASCRPMATWRPACWASHVDGWLASLGRRGPSAWPASRARAAAPSPALRLAWTRPAPGTGRRLTSA